MRFPIKLIRFIDTCHPPHEYNAIQGITPLATTQLAQTKEVHNSPSLMQQDRSEEESPKSWTEIVEGEETHNRKSNYMRLLSLSSFTYA
ncbi:hypothetical protein RND71_015502 [Anisodus tanguticus]|uniref:Uncharacterized protein n=1 Tax=Anisodus tanguticus TaxID=243964 RepID=A0AAE1S705_9SOLA|nr:hypothetical protein RND71_015502 [Anisodus tanguticus]